MSAATPTTEAHPMSDEKRVDVLTESAPERIWLQVDTNGDETDRTEPLKSEDWFELTWHFEPIGGQEIEYIRADIVAELIATLNAIAQMSPMQVMNLKAKVGSPDAAGWNFAVAAKSALSTIRSTV